MMYNESEKQKQEDFPGYVKNKAHKFPFFFIKMTKSQYNLLCREGLINLQSQGSTLFGSEEEAVKRLGSGLQQPLIN